jgi:integrase/recombinase XerD
MFDYENKDLLDELLDSYAEHLSKKGKSRISVQSYQNPNRKLIRFAKEKGITKPKEITEELLKEFQMFLYEERDFAHDSVATFMKHIKMFFDFLISIGKLKENIVRKTEILPKPELPDKQLAHFYTFSEILRRYSRDQEKWVSFSYLNQVKKHLTGFFKYLRTIGIKSVYPVTEGMLIQYRDFLWDELVEHKKDSLAVRSQIERLRCVVRLFRYLMKEGILKDNPAKNLDWQLYYKEILEKKKTLPAKPLPDNDLTELDKIKLEFLDYQKAIGKNSSTTEKYKKAVEIFYDFMKNKGIQNLTQVNKKLLLEYHSYLCNYKGVRGKPACSHYKAYILWTAKLFFKFLVRFDYLAKDPCADLETIKEERGLPRDFMNEKEIFEILEQPKLNHNPLILRDKAIMYVLFSTGMRSNELCQLNLEDIDSQQEMIRINSPKGGASHQRVVPISKTALDYLNLYIKDSRSQLENGDHKAVFLSYSGRRMNSEAVLNMVKKYAFECGFRKNITTHSFRVSCATLLLKNGANIRYVQDHLGHKRITSTQIYTRLMPVDLKTMQRSYHPIDKKEFSGSGGALSAGVSGKKTAN